MTNPQQALEAKARTARYLFRYGYLDLLSAADKLQRYAERNGIVRELGQDHVQQIISGAFADIPIEPSLTAVARGSA